MRVLVTGGAGFIGSHTVDLLLSKGFEPIVVDDFRTGHKGNIPNGVKIHEIDITNSRIEEIFKQELPEIVIHLAAQVDVQKSIQFPLQDAMINIIGTLRLLTLSEKYKVRKFIFASSAAVYGDTVDRAIKEEDLISPLSYYGISKYSSESYIRIFQKYSGIPFTILRYANVYGPRQQHNAEGGVVSIFITKLLSGSDVSIYGSGEQTRDFVFVKDIAKANVMAIEKLNNEVINIGTNTKTSIKQLYYEIAEQLNVSKSPQYSMERNGDILYSCLDNEKAESLLNWEPDYSLKRGIKETIEYYKALSN